MTKQTSEGRNALYAQALGRRLGADALTPAQLRVLVAVLGICQESRRGATWRGILGRVGYKSPNAIKTMMDKLRRLGLVVSDGSGAATTVPLYRLELFDPGRPD